MEIPTVEDLRLLNPRTMANPGFTGEILDPKVGTGGETTLEKTTTHSARSKMKTNKSSKPVCVFCKRSGTGVQFNIFNPRFKPFGTACVDCEKSLPADTKVPEKETTK